MNEKRDISLESFFGNISKIGPNCCNINLQKVMLRMIFCELILHLFEYYGIILENFSEDLKKDNLFKFLITICVKFA